MTGSRESEDSVAAYSPLRVALRSVRANLVPMLVLWLFAAIFVATYYWMPGGRAPFEPLTCRKNVSRLLK